MDWECILSNSIWQAYAAESAEEKMMKIDVSFGWQHNDGIADSNSGKETLTRDHGDYDITRPVAILKLVDSSSSGAVKESAADPYNNEYWTEIPRQ